MMPSGRAPRADDDAVSAVGSRHQRRCLVVLAALAVSVLSFAAFVSCAGLGVHPESAIIMGPPDEVWDTTLTLLRERDFKIDQQDIATHTLRATRAIVLRMVTDRATPTTAQKIQHQIDLSVRPGGDGKSVLEVIYRIDKVVEEEQGFRFLQTVRDRVALGVSGPTRSSPRR